MVMAGIADIGSGMRFLDLSYKSQLHSKPIKFCATPPPVRSAAALDFHKSANPSVNHACEGFRLGAPYKNLMPDDLRWS